MRQKPLRIGGATGFWGDTEISVRQLVERGNIDVLVFDYLAETTLSIMARMRAKNPEAGFATDFVPVLAELLPQIHAKGITVISNAGGMNPQACAAALKAAAEKLGLSPRIAVVTGDDLIDRAADFAAKGTREMFSGAPFPERPLSINAYLGAKPIVEALARGADIVITGRCVDSAVTLAPLIHAFGWSFDDYDRLAQGSLAGHILECGAQATGGLFTDWETVPNWADIGYPIAECYPDGSFIVDKPKDTGGLITPATVAEQVVYEIGDPAAYFLPDVVCDFAQLRLEQTGPDRVRVSGAKGRPPGPDYKASVTFPDGFKLVATLMIGGIDARRKALRVAEAIIERVSKRLADKGLPGFTDTHVEVLGSEATYGPHSRMAESREVILKASIRHPRADALDMFAREWTSSGTSMAPGITGSGGGRASPAPVIRLFSCTVPKESVPVTVTLDDDSIRLNSAALAGDPGPSPVYEFPAKKPAGALRTVRLVEVAHGRSGDKGNMSNIGIIARTPELFPYLLHELTPERIGAYMAHKGASRVERYVLPGFNAMNFVLHDALGGGGMASLRFDPLGKAHAQQLLDMTIEVPADLVPRST